MMRKFSRRTEALEPTETLPFLPSSSPTQTFVRVSPLDGGQYTEPEDLMIQSPNTHDPYVVVPVPSLPFIIQHPGTPLFNRHGKFSKPCNILFDRGLRSNPLGYSLHTQKELEHRRPIRFPDPMNKQLSRRNLDVSDIDLIILSHLHWSHTGDASDFSSHDVSYIVGPGALTNFKTQLATHSLHLDSNLTFPRHRTIELPPPGSKGAYSNDVSHSGPLSLDWQPLGPLAATLDLFNDGSVYLVDLPGHTPSHIGMLCRCAPGKWALLAGDAAHDSRLMVNGEIEIAHWHDQMGREQCVHEDREQTDETVQMIRRLIGGQREGGYQVEVVLSHDMDWVMGNLDHFWPEALF